MDRPQRALAGLAMLAGVLLVAGCGGAASTVGTVLRSRAAPTAPPPALGAPVAASTATIPPSAAAVEQFGGWDAETGRDSSVFRMTLTESSVGQLHGRLVYVETWSRHRARTVVAFVGSARPDGCCGNRQRVNLHLATPVAGVLNLHGYVSDLYASLSSPSSSSHELELYGSRFDVRRQFVAHIRATGGRGGYNGWLRRRGESRAAVRHLDIDGDGRPDLVTVVWKHLRNPLWGTGTREVLVRFANGTIQSLDVPATNTSNGDRSPVGWAGSVHLPGIPGRQLVLTDDIGAANTFYDVIADVGGRLTELPAPAPDNGWGEGGTVGTGDQDRFCAGGDLVAVTSRMLNRPHRFFGHDSVRFRASRYVWGGRGWRRVRAIDRVIKPGTRVPDLRHGHRGLWNCG
jgi:hypothetical protein